MKTIKEKIIINKYNNMLNNIIVNNIKFKYIFTSFLENMLFNFEFFK